MSTAGLVIGVAGGTNSTKTLLTAGLAGLLAGSLSLAAGEYVSISTHRELIGTTGLSLELRERAEPEKSSTPEPWPEDRSSSACGCSGSARAVRMVTWRY